jgi:hypothetical protein
MDWRVMNKDWKEQGTETEAQDLAQAQMKSLQQAGSASRQGDCLHPRANRSRVDCHAHR